MCKYNSPERICVSQTQHDGCGDTGQRDSFRILFTSLAALVGSELGISGVSVWAEADSDGLANREMR